MFSVGEKLEINPKFAGIVDVCGLYPAGQSGYSENHYEIMINGYRLRVPQTFLGEAGIFQKIELKPVVVEESPIEIKPKVPVVKDVKVEKPKTKARR